MIDAQGNSAENVYIQSALVNGVALTEPRIPYSAIAAGGTLVLEMGPRPNTRLWR